MSNRNIWAWADSVLEDLETRGREDPVLRAPELVMLRRDLAILPKGNPRVMAIPGYCHAPRMRSEAWSEESLVGLRLERRDAHEPTAAAVRAGRHRHRRLQRDDALQQ